MIVFPRSPRGKHLSGERDLSRCLRFYLSDGSEVSREHTRRAGKVGVSISATERVRAIEPGGSYVSKQGFTYGAGAFAETVGAKRICMNLLAMPDGTRARCITIAASRR
jgi:hypothetical protein